MSLFGRALIAVVLLFGLVAGDALALRTPALDKTRRRHRAKPSKSPPQRQLLLNIDKYRKKLRRGSTWLRDKLSERIADHPYRPLRTGNRRVYKTRYRIEQGAKSWVERGTATETVHRTYTRGGILYADIEHTGHKPTVVSSPPGARLEHGSPGRDDLDLAFLGSQTALPRRLGEGERWRDEASFSHGTDVYSWSSTSRVLSNRKENISGQRQDAVTIETVVEGRIDAGNGSVHSWRAEVQTVYVKGVGRHSSKSKLVQTRRKTSGETLGIWVTEAESVLDATASKVPLEETH
jgi:hypothetical protein